MQTSLSYLFYFLLATSVFFIWYIYLLSAEPRVKWIGKHSCEICEEVDIPIQENRNSQKLFFYWLVPKLSGQNVLFLCSR
jgi:hypothetical protein